MKQTTEVNSTTISEIGYDSETNEMTVRFAHGGAYLYKGVSSEEHNAFITASSIGKHFQSHIRPRYTGAKQASPVEEVKAS